MIQNILWISYYDQLFHNQFWHSNQMYLALNSLDMFLLDIYKVFLQLVIAVSLNGYSLFIDSSWDKTRHTTEEHENKYAEIRELNLFYINEQNNLANIILPKNRFFFLHTITMRSVCDTSIVLHTLTRFSHDPGQWKKIACFLIKLVWINHKSNVIKHTNLRQRLILLLEAKSQ